MLDYWGYRVRAFTGREGIDISCEIYSVLITFAGTGTFYNSPLLAIAIYIFVKYETKKLKWVWIIAYISITSLLITILAIIHGAFDAGGLTMSGFCLAELDLKEGSVFQSVLILVHGFIFLFTVIIVAVLSVLSYCYVKKNTAISSDSPKRVIT